MPQNNTCTTTTPMLTMLNCWYSSMWASSTPRRSASCRERIASFRLFSSCSYKESIFTMRRMSARVEVNVGGGVEWHFFPRTCCQFKLPAGTTSSRSRPQSDLFDIDYSSIPVRSPMLFFVIRGNCHRQVKYYGFLTKLTVYSSHCGNRRLGYIDTTYHEWKG